jgi:hypothetical protein
MPKAVQLTVSSSRPVEYLADLSPTTGRFESSSGDGTFQLSGRVQLHALADKDSCYSTENAVEYNLGGHYDTLAGLAGLDDASPSADAKVTLEGGRLTVTSDAPVDFDRIVEAVAEAGDYTVA